MCWFASVLSDELVASELCGLEDGVLSGESGIAQAFIVARPAGHNARDLFED